MSPILGWGMKESILFCFICQDYMLAIMGGGDDNILPPGRGWECHKDNPIVGVGDSNQFVAV